MTSEYPHCLRCGHSRDKHGDGGCNEPVTVGPFNGYCPCARVVPAKDVQK